MGEKRVRVKREFEQPKLTRYGRLSSITMSSGALASFGGSGTVSGGKAGDFFGGQQQ